MTSSKEFVIKRILEQAKIESVPLDDIEIRMLRFTEATSAAKDLEAAEIFERDYDDEQYGAKIASLIRQAYERDKKSGQEESWSQALARLASRDLYLNVLIDRAGIDNDPLGPFSNWRFVLYGLLPPALCLGAAVLIGFSPLGARWVRSDSLRLLITVCFLAAPFALPRHRRKKASVDGKSVR